MSSTKTVLNQCVWLLLRCRTVEFMLPAEHSEGTASLPLALDRRAPALTRSNVTFVVLMEAVCCRSDQWSISVESNRKRFLLHVRSVSQCSTAATLFFSAYLSLISHLSSLVCVCFNLKHTHTHTHDDEQARRGQPALMKLSHSHSAVKSTRAETPVDRAHPVHPIIVHYLNRDA